MPQQILENDNPFGTRVTLGDNLVKINANFSEVYGAVAALQTAVSALQTGGGGGGTGGGGTGGPADGGEF